MRRPAYLVIALVTALSLALVAHSGGTILLPSISDAHASTDSIVLTGCDLKLGSCTNTGWNGTTAMPNPTITVAHSDVVKIALSSADTLQHEFQLDVDNDGGEMSDCGTTDPCSVPFPPSTTFMFTVMASPATYTYYCVFHTVVMHGTFVVSPSTTVGGVAVSGVNPVIVGEYISIASLVLVVIGSTTFYLWRMRRRHLVD